ncbi:hypothetical protein GCM10009000_015610 [Halobacterium noricense]|uniref:Uncharacterized protein n=1 Tax=Haladaptatus pallidirubidus TaxID=1008152 RepID=A0AAV3UB37_9EURY
MLATARFMGLAGFVSLYFKKLSDKSVKNIRPLLQSTARYKNGSTDEKPETLDVNYTKTKTVL